MFFGSGSGNQEGVKDCLNLRMVSCHDHPPKTAKTRTNDGFIRSGLSFLWEGPL